MIEEHGELKKIEMPTKSMRTITTRAMEEAKSMCLRKSKKKKLDKCRMIKRTTLHPTGEIIYGIHKKQNHRKPRKPARPRAQVKKKD